MKRRTKVSQTAVTKAAAEHAPGLSFGEAQGLVRQASSKTTSVTLRLSGPWHDLWERLKAAVPEVTDAELLRQGVALRIALAARDARGKKPRAVIEYHDEAGKLVTADLEEYVGISEKKAG